MSSKLPQLLAGPQDGLPRILGEEHSRLADVDGSLVAVGQSSGDDGSTIVAVSTEGSTPVALPDVQRNDDHQVCIAAFPGKRLFVSATREGGVTLYSLPSGKHERTLMLCPMRVQSMAISNNHLLVVAAEDGVLRFQDLAPLADDPSSSAALAGRDVLLGGAYVKSVAFSPSGEELAVFLRDGTLQLLADFRPAPVGDDAAAVALKSVQLLKAHTNVRMAEVDDGATATHYPLAWHPSGDALAVGTQKGVMILARSTGWDVAYKLTQPNVRTATHDLVPWTGTNALAWSPNGRYIAAVDGRRLLSVWDCTVGNVDATGRHDVKGSVYQSIALRMHGYVPIIAHNSFGAGLGTYDEFSQAASSSGAGAGGRASGQAVEAFTDIAESSDRITGMVWGRDGRCLYHIGTQGSLGYVTVKDKLEADGGGSVTELVTEGALQFPLPADAAAAAGGDYSSSGAGAGAGASAMDGDGYGEIDADELAAVERMEAEHAAKTAAGASRGDAATGGSAGRSSSKGKGKNAGAAGEMLDDEAAESDAEDDVEAGTGSRSRSRGGAGAGAGAAGGAGDDDDADLSLAAVKRKYGFVDDDGDEEEGGGLRRVYGADGGAGGGSSGGSGGGLLADDFSAVQYSILDRLLKANREVAHKEVRRAMGFVAPQRPFQPTATKPGKDGARHFLAWNAIAAVVARDQLIGGERVDSAVSVDFADTARLKAISFSDKARFTMAAVSEHGVILGAPYVPPLGGSRTEDAPGEGYPAQLRFFALDGFGSPAAQKWALSLPVFAPRQPEVQMPVREPEATFDGVRRERDTSVAAESPVAVAVGDGWAAAGTDAQLLRIFRSGGSQDATFSVPGPIVTVVGRGALCAVIYHSAAPSMEKQHLVADVYLVRVGVDAGATGGSAVPRLLSRVALPMRPRMTLNWASVSPNGWLMVHDSDGQLHAAGAGMDWSWMPVCDTKHAAAHPELFAGTAGAGSSGAGAGDEAAVRPPAHDRSTSDAFFPLDIVMAPSHLAKGSGVDEGKHAVAPPGGMVPLLQAVLIKGGRASPQCSSPLPLRNWLPLRLPVLDGQAFGAAGGRPEVLRLEEASIRHEALRVQREWMLSQGLAPLTGDYLSMTAAATAAAAAQRGEVGDAADAGAVMKGLIDDAVKDTQRYGIAIDKTVLAQADALLQGGMEFRASQLAGRLHIDKSFTMAQKFAGRYGPAAGAASDRFGQLLLVRQGLASGEVLASAPAPDTNGAGSAVAIAELAKFSRGGGGAGAVAAAGASVEALLEGTAALGGGGGAAGGPRTFGLGARLAAATNAAAERLAARMVAEAGVRSAGASAAGGSAGEDAALPPTAALLAGLAAGSSAHAASSAGAAGGRSGSGSGAGARGAAAGSSAAGASSGGAGAGGRAARAPQMPYNPFAPKTSASSAAAAAGGAGAGASSSPGRGQGKRAREVSGLEALAVASPQRGAAPAAGRSAAAGGGAVLNRQSSFAQEAREAKRQRQREEQN